MAAATVPPAVTISLAVYAATVSTIGLLWQYFVWRRSGISVKVRIQAAMLYDPLNQQLYPAMYLITVNSKTRGTTTINDVGYETKAKPRRPRVGAGYSIGNPSAKVPHLGPTIPAAMGPYGELTWQIPATLAGLVPASVTDLQLRGYVSVGGQKKYAPKPVFVPNGYRKALLDRFSNEELRAETEMYQARTYGDLPNLWDRLLRRSSSAADFTWVDVKSSKMSAHRAAIAALPSNFDK